MKTGIEKGQLSLLKLIFTLKAFTKLDKFNYQFFGFAGLWEQKMKNTDLPKVKSLKTLEKSMRVEYKWVAIFQGDCFKGKKYSAVVYTALKTGGKKHLPENSKL